MNKQYLVSPLEVVQLSMGYKMKYTLAIITALLLLSNCGPKQDKCDKGGTAVLNGQTQTLTNGSCSAALTSGTLTVNSQIINVSTVTMCGQVWGYLYNSILYNSSLADPTSPTGFTKYPDNYYVNQTSASTQCWFNITNGSINQSADIPTF